MTKNCADDTAVLAEVNNYGDKQHLQNDMTRYISYMV